MFYLLKYAEQVGVQSLVQFSSQERTMSYDSKRKIVEYILETESTLGVQDSSWKHCLIYLFMTGSMDETQFRD